MSTNHQCRSCGGFCGGGYGKKFCQQGSTPIKTTDTASRALVVVRGGVAEVYTTPDVTALVVDLDGDSYEQPSIPDEFKALADRAGLAD